MKLINRFKAYVQTAEQVYETVLLCLALVWLTVFNACMFLKLPLVVAIVVATMIVVIVAINTMVIAIANDDDDVNNDRLED